MGVIRKKAVIVACASNENLYIRDWAEYHLKLGFKKIFIIDNSPEPGGDYPEYVLGDYVAKKKVQIIRLRKHKTNPKGLQMAAYTVIYKAFYRQFDWMFFIDVDEFVTFLENSGIKKIYDFLARPEIDGADQIKMNWLIYTDNGLVHYDPRPVYKRFTEIMMPLDKHDWSFPVPVNMTLKSAINCKKSNIADFVSTNSPHFALTSKIDKAVCVTPSGQPTEWNKAVGTIDYDVMCLRHYRCMTIEEFLYRKILNNGKGNALGCIFDKDTYIKMFSVENVITEEKKKIIDDFFDNLSKIQPTILEQEDNSMNYNEMIIKIENVIFGKEIWPL